MKKVLIFLFIAGLTLLFSTGACAGWKLYDNFESGVINLNKWSIDDSSADISIVGGKAMFVHNPDNAGDSSWLKFIKCPETIVGVRATILVESWEGDVRARIGAIAGVLKENTDYQVWCDMSLRNQWASWMEPPVWHERVQGGVSVHDMNWNWLYDNVHTSIGEWKYPTVIDIPYTITTKFDMKTACFQVNNPSDLGKVTYKYGDKILPFEPFRGIGTRSNDAAGACVVYFDDVYVLRKGDCDNKRPKVVSSTPADGERKVSVNLSEISIKFKEAMQNRYSWDTPPPWSVVETTFQFPKRFTQENISGEPLEYNTWYEICVNADGFFDLAGNTNKEYCFRFKTEKE